MASSVATPLERQFTAIAGLDSMISTSSLGSTSITLQFDLNRDIDGARWTWRRPSPPHAAAAAGDAESAFLPQINPADFPILMLALTSPTLPMWELNEYAETLIAQRISR